MASEPGEAGRVWDPRRGRGEAFGGDGVCLKVYQDLLTNVLGSTGIVALSSLAFFGLGFLPKIRFKSTFGGT